MLDPTSRPPVLLSKIVRLLDEHGVRWVLTGSTVLAVYGGELAPNDIDVTPALDADNLDRLASALASVEALPAYVADWDDGLTIERCRAWRPTPATEENLDHLFVTTIGMIDVPPRLCGTYDELLPAATDVDVAGVTIAVCDPDEVLRRLDGRTRSKDVARADVYDRLRQQPPAERRATGVARLVQRLA